MKVLFAPDYRRAVPYQSLLAEALGREGVEVEFLSGYRRGLPLTRSVRAHGADVLHLHWPEEYYLAGQPGWSFLRKLRYPLDLVLATRRTPMVLTAHDLRPHHRGHEPLVAACADRTLRRAEAVFAHSSSAAALLAKEHGVKAERIRVIPHGDLSVSTGPPADQTEARLRLGLGSGKICLICGTIEPYKGIEPVIEYWKRQPPHAILAVVGKPKSPEYQAEITRLAGEAPNIRLVFGFQSEARLGLWLSAVDCVIFNYVSIFTSGAAALARSMGLPIVLPRRLGTVDLAEPDSRVRRFDGLDTSFGEALEASLALGPDWKAAEPWRKMTGWDEVARITLETYRKILS